MVKQTLICVGEVHVLPINQWVGVVYSDYYTVYIWSLAHFSLVFPWKEGDGDSYGMSIKPYLIQV